MKVAVAWSDGSVATDPYVAGLLCCSDVSKQGAGRVTSMTSKRVYASKGMVRVLTAPGILKAVIGPGYAVCARTADGSVGGIAHIGVDDAPAGGRLTMLVGELVDALVEAGDSLRGAVAEIVGGADVLRLFPRNVHANLVRNHLDALVAELAARSVEARISRVGGRLARAVELFLPEGQLEVRRVGNERRRQAAGHDSSLPDGDAETVEPLLVADHIVNMACMEVVNCPARLTAVLGSCVGIALRDRGTGIGGLVHVMMPTHNGYASPAAKHADTAVPALVDALVAAGARREMLEAKLVGGANVFSFEPHGLLRCVGACNIDAARAALAAAGVPIVWQDVGGRIGRKMRLELPSFRIDVRLLRRDEDPA